jgi:hypothetical protein
MKSKEYTFVYNSALIKSAIQLLNDIHFTDEHSKLLFLEIKKELFTLNKMTQDKVTLED